MDMKEVIKSQFHASLEILKQAVDKCPDGIWDDPDKKNRYWHIAYHALFYTHLYLQPDEGSFTAWEKHKEAYHNLGPPPRSSDDAPRIDEPYSKEELQAYHDLCRNQIDETVDYLDLHGDSGFSWLPMSKLELQFYNIRHLQMHVGELCERLGSEAGIDVQWIGMRPDAK